MFVSVYIESDGTVTVTNHENEKVVILGPDEVAGQAITSALSEIKDELV